MQIFHKVLGSYIFFKHPVQQKNRQQDSRSTRGELTGRVLPTMSARRRDSVQCSTYRTVSARRRDSQQCSMYRTVSARRRDSLQCSTYCVCMSS